MSELLLATKLYIPRRAGLIERPRLLSQLDDGLRLGRRLTLISAPAGYGKTTLVQEWIDRRILQAAWVSLDEGDNDLARFLNYLIASLQSVHPDLGTAAQAALQSSQPQQPGGVLIPLVNDLAGVSQPLLIVLDDYHFISSAAVHEAVAFLVERLPPPAHLVIATRADPPLPIPRLRGRGLVTELRLGDLCFDDSEAEALLETTSGLKLPTAYVQTLARRTEGWAAGLQMASLALRAQVSSTPQDSLISSAAAFVKDFAGSTRYILDYLMEEVLHGQPEVVQTFLLNTSILERQCAPLCDVLCDGFLPLQVGSPGVNSQEILEQLEHANLFILPLDDHRGWYRYHRLFADLLRQRLHQTWPERVSQLHGRASQWFELNHFLPEAVDHTFAAGDFERAARLVAQIAQGMLMRSEVGTLLRWLDQLPDAQLRSYPILVVYHAWVMLLSSRPMQEIEALLSELDAAGPGGQTASLRAFLAAYRGDFAKALAFSNQAVQNLNQEDAYLRGAAALIQGMYLMSEGSPEEGFPAVSRIVEESLQAGNTLLACLGLCVLGDNHRKLGRLRQGEACYQQAVNIAVDQAGQRLPAAARALLGAGDLHREWNHLDQAGRLLQEGLELVGQSGQVGGFLGYISLARLRHAEGDWAGARQALDEARRLAEDFDVTEMDDLIVDVTEVQLSILNGDMQTAQRWFADRSMVAGNMRPGGKISEDYLRAHMRKYESLLLGRLWLAERRPAEALELLDAVLPEFEDVRRPAAIIETHILRALALVELGQPSTALTVLGQALAIAEPQGYMRVFLDEGHALYDLLRTTRPHLVDDHLVAYADRLLAAFTATPTGEVEYPPPTASWINSLTGEQVATQVLIEPLSEREMDVLRLLPSALSSSEMADELVVSVNTLRSHLKNIYAKLGVHSRYEAAARARELGLI